MIDEKIFIRSSDFNVYKTDIYTLDGNDIELLSTFIGRMEINHKNRYILHNQNQFLYIRDLDDFNKILFDKVMPSGFYGVQIIKDNYYLSSNIYWLQSRVFNYSIENDFLNHIHTFENISEILYNMSGEIISSNAFYGDFSEYFSIFFCHVIKIGEKEDIRTVQRTILIPETGKLVQWAFSGIWVYDFDYTVTDGDIVVESTKEAVLHSNFPNPFNPETTIMFSTENVYNVEINVYNVRGQRVRTLVNDFFEIGHHQVVWNGKDDNGRDVSSGVYLYQMIAGETTETRRMVLLK
jgi:hypothetical protein